MGDKQILEAAEPRVLYAVREDDHDWNAVVCLFATPQAAEATIADAAGHFYVDKIKVFATPQKQVTLHWIQRYAAIYDRPDARGSMEVWEFDAPDFLALDGYVAYGATADEARARLEANLLTQATLSPPRSDAPPASSLKETPE